MIITAIMVQCANCTTLAYCKPLMKFAYGSIKILYCVLFGILLIQIYGVRFTLSDYHESADFDMINACVDEYTMINKSIFNRKVEKGLQKTTVPLILTWIFIGLTIVESSIACFLCLKMDKQDDGNDKWSLNGFFENR